jgi:hypothetical protein
MRARILTGRRAGRKVWRIFAIVGTLGGSRTEGSGAAGWRGEGAQAGGPTARGYEGPSKDLLSVPEPAAGGESAAST